MKDTIDEVEDKETNETIAQIIASKFDIYPHHENYFFLFLMIQIKDQMAEIA